MSDPTNPRTVYETGGSVVISLPRDWMAANGIDQGDKFVLESTDEGFEAVEVEYRRASNV